MELPILSLGTLELRTQAACHRALRNTPAPSPSGRLAVAIVVVVAAAVVVAVCAFAPVSLCTATCDHLLSPHAPVAAATQPPRTTATLHMMRVPRAMRRRTRRCAPAHVHSARTPSLPLSPSTLLYRYSPLNSSPPRLSSPLLSPLLLRSSHQ